MSGLISHTSSETMPGGVRVTAIHLTEEGRKALSVSRAGGIYAYPRFRAATDWIACGARNAWSWFWHGGILI